MTITRSYVASLIDHTLLKPDATKEGFEKLCKEARDYGFAMVAINPAPVKLCKELLQHSNVHVGAAIAFPLGQTTIEDKVNETKTAIENGADEIDYVINITELKAGNTDYIEDEMRCIVDVCRKHDVIVKVIFENCYLTDDEKRAVAAIAKKVKPDFIKTSTGFGPSGATFDDVKLMREVVGNEVKIKAAGGIRTAADALKFIKLGVSRIGTSAGIDIINTWEEQ